MSSFNRRAEHIALFVYYFPPVSSPATKRMEALAKYAIRAGRRVTVITSAKSESDGLLSEPTLPGVTVLELNALGRLSSSGGLRPPGEESHLDVKPVSSGIWRKVKDLVLRTTGQLIDHRMPFAASIKYPWLATEVKAALKDADIAVGTCPPWPPLWAALNAGSRFGLPVVLDYRDQLSCCHEMPGSKLAKRLEISLDSYLNRRAAGVVTISDPMQSYYSRFHRDVVTILNGYDQEKIQDAIERKPWRQRDAGEALTVRYLGLVSEGRIPRNLLEAMQILHETGEIRPGAMALEFYGNSRILKNFLNRQYPQLEPYFSLFAAVPYADALDLIVSADHVLFCERMIPPLPGQEDSAEGILPTKLYEYLASGRPILGNIPPATLAGRFIQKVGKPHFVSESTDEFLAYLRSDAFWNPATASVDDFVRTLSREAQSKRYLDYLDQVVARSDVRKTSA